MTSDLLDVEEAAAFLHVKVATVRSWVLKSKISYVKHESHVGRVGF